MFFNPYSGPNGIYRRITGQSCGGKLHRSCNETSFVFTTRWLRTTTCFDQCGHHKILNIFWQGNCCFLLLLMLLNMQVLSMRMRVWDCGLWDVFENNTQQERTQPTNSTTHALRENLHIYQHKQQQKTAVSSPNNFNTWWWPHWSKHVVLDFQTFKVNNF
jgi:hypothetical protein